MDVQEMAVEKKKKAVHGMETVGDFLRNTKTHQEVK
jgi:hypothetical protein